MDTLPLPPRPDLAQYRKRAKALVKAFSTNRPDALDVWAKDWLDALARLRGSDDARAVGGDDVVRKLAGAARKLVAESSKAHSRVTLADAQRFIAQANGFPDWHEFAQTVEWIAGGPGAVSHTAFPQGGDAPTFDAARDAVLDGDVTTLRDFLDRHPDLVRARSNRAHRATLLHYVAANGVELQRTPPNAVDVARLLLVAGAEVDASANTYSGGKAQTTMNLVVSSVHPANAGLQEALVEVLLDFGAAIDGPEDDSSPLMTALAFGYGQAAATLARRGARIDNVVAAAALAQVDVLTRLLEEGDSIAPSLAALYWIPVTMDPKARRGLALVWAAALGETAVVELLLDHGADPRSTDRSRMTPLHWAAANRHLDIVKLLLKAGAPLEAKNEWGGTVLSSTAWFVVNGVWFPATHPRGEQAARPTADYAEIFETLIAAGANVGAVDFRTGDREVDEVLRRHGAPSP